MIEDEILFRSHFLILYAQKYFLMMRWNLPDLDRAGCLIADRMQEIYAVRNRVKELPVSVAEVFYAGGVLAGAVLQKKPRLWKEDFSHITLCSYEIQKSLEGIMQMFENCVDELEI